MLRVAVSVADLQMGKKLWVKLTDNTPQSLSEIVSDGVPGWPFMTQALRRFCCEFPAIETGLTLTQTYLLLAIMTGPEELPALEYRLREQERQGGLKGDTAEQRYYEILSGPATFTRVFHHLQQLEVNPFMGDLSVKLELERLLTANLPYISVRGEEGAEHYCLTRAGVEALQGQRRWQSDNELDLWRGGVHITNENLWMWDQHDQQFVYICKLN